MSTHLPDEELRKDTIELSGYATAQSFKVGWYSVNEMRIGGL